MLTDLNPTDITPNQYKYWPFYVRKSHIESFSFCPRQFYIQYVEERDPFPNYAMTAGTRFHDFAEKFFDVAPYYLPHQWYDFIPDEFGTYERTMCSNFIDGEVDRYMVTKHFVPAFREVQLYSDTHQIAGKLDRADWVIEDESVEIIEYKTSSKVDELSLRRQLGLYTILVEEDLGVAVENVKLINPRLNVYQDFGRPDTDLPLKWVDKIRAAYEDHALCAPKCSTGKYAVCQLCQSTDEAGLFKDLEWDGEY